MDKGVDVRLQRQPSPGHFPLSLYAFCVGVHSKESKLLMFNNDYGNTYLFKEVTFFSNAFAQSIFLLFRLLAFFMKLFQPNTCLFSGKNLQSH